MLRTALTAEKSYGSHVLRVQLARIVSFAVVSSAGLLLDLLLFLALRNSGMIVFGASAISSAAAVAFVYFASVRRVFRYAGQFLVSMFAAYAVYQVCGILLSSWVVSALAHAGMVPAVAKVAILPVTFGCNYLFMSWLTVDSRRWIGR